MKKFALLFLTLILLVCSMALLSSCEPDDTAHSHTYGEWTQTLAPTCTDKGSEQRNCTSCEHFETREIEALGHTNAVAVVENTVDATCTANGSYDSVIYCSVCSGEVSREAKTIDALGHDYSTEWTVDLEPTCTTVGSKSHHCSRCSDKADVTEIPANGHSFSAWEEVKKPTCTQKGSERRDCDVCEHYETRETNANGHTNADAVIENQVDATCTVDGSYDLVVYCSVCLDEVSRKAKTIDALGHDYSTEWTIDVEPDCTETGSKSHHCSRCSDKADVTEIPANGHSVSTWKQVKAPNCTQKGSELRTCSVCGHDETREVKELGHDHSTEWTIDLAPTCTTAGSKSHHCSRCSDKADVTVIPANGHTWGEWTQTKAPNCTEKGSLHRDCSVCGHGETSEIKELGHNHSTEWTIDLAPTCTTAGSKSHHCSRCSDKADVTVIPANGHDHKAVVTAPTCTASGYTTYTCHCGNTYKADETATLGHTEVIDEAVDATCTATGLTAGQHCDVCGETLVAQQVVPANGHTWSEWTQTKAPNCTEKGTERRDCDVCDHFETREINALGHDHSTEWTIDLAPTCTTAGSKSHHCSRCSDQADVTVIPANGHTWGEWTQTKAPNCTEKGTERRDCDVCDHFETRDIDALGHNHSTEWTIDLAPTCTTAGSKSHHCSRCSDKADVTVIPANGHTWSEWTQTKAPNCTEKGSERRDCDICDHFETRDIEALGHTNAAAVVENKVEATCTADGSYDSVIYCSVCDAEVSREAKTIDALGHDHSTEWTIDLAPTCTTAGSKSHHCSRCSNKANVTVIPATGHTWGEWIQTKAPTCTEKGSERRDCDACDHFETREIEANGHTEVIDQAVAPTCTATGLTEGKHCSTCDAVLITQEIVPIAHNWSTTYEYDKGAHWKQCTSCNATNTKEAHTLGSDGYCKMCNNPIAGSDGVFYYVSSDGTYAEVIDYVGDSARVVIAETYEGVPVTHISSAAFKEKAINSIVLPNSITSIGSSAFYGCSSLTSVTIPDGVTSIGSSAFYGCSSLKSITLPFVGAAKNGTSNTHFGYVFGASSYYYNRNYVPAALKTVVITGGTSIDDYAFYNCSSLTNITIPDSVTSIGKSAFQNCNSLTTVYYGGTASDWSKISIGYMANLTNATRYYYSETKPTTSGNYWHYVNDVPKKW